MVSMLHIAACGIPSMLFRFLRFLAFVGKSTKALEFGSLRYACRRRWEHCQQTENSGRVRRILLMPQWLRLLWSCITLFRSSQLVDPLKACWRFSFYVTTFKYTLYNNYIMLSTPTHSLLFSCQSWYMFHYVSLYCTLYIFVSSFSLVASASRMGSANARDLPLDVPVVRHRWHFFPKTSVE